MVIRCAFTAQVCIRFQDNGTKLTLFSGSTKHLMRFLKKKILCKEQTAKEVSTQVTLVSFYQDQKSLDA